jgi:hypothetical protein
MYYNLLLLKEINKSDFTSLLKEISNRVANNFDEQIDILPIVEVISKECNQFQNTINN